jgi:UDP-N-acetyl-2-amino-2-deoxyglucuronate dehydrogenase
MGLNFALIGAAGYIASRHMKAIKETGNNLVVATDKNDNVGIIDSYFPSADFFIEFERFDRHVEKLHRLGQESRIHYVSICSPNYMHDSHIRFALRSGADAICEKPLVLNPWNVDALKESEAHYGSKVYTVLQLRLHPSIVMFKKEVEVNPRRKHEIELTYITSRGNWYHYSWKGQVEKSGGIATNIGVHFFDMLYWVFGDVLENRLHYIDDHRAGGYLEFEKARVKWFLSIDSRDLPPEAKSRGQKTHRSFTCDGREIEFTSGFEDLHTRVYEDILNGGGFCLDEAKTSIQIVHDIRNARPFFDRDLMHPLLKNR